MKTFILLIITTLLTAQAFAEVAVIVHPDNNSIINKDEVQRIFLGKKTTFENGQSATPYNLANETVRAEFDSRMLDKTSSELRTYWSKLVFTGKGTPPVEFATPAELIAKVSSDPSAIGYVDAAAVPDSVKVAFKF